MTFSAALSGAVIFHTPVATIFENLESGASIDDVLAWYEGLDRKQVQGIIHRDLKPANIKSDRTAR